MEPKSFAVFTVEPGRPYEWAVVCIDPEDNRVTVARFASEDSALDLARALNACVEIMEPHPNAR